MREREGEREREVERERERERLMLVDRQVILDAANQNFLYIYRMC